jgi:hypothetical protein
MLSESVTPPRGAGHPRTVAPNNDTGALAATKSEVQRQAPPTSVTQPQQTSQRSQQSPATQTQLAKVTEVAADLTTVRRVPVDAKGRRQLPDDAMLILTQDLYL